MATLRQGVERLYENGILVPSETLSVRSLQQSFQPIPQESIRSLMLKIFDSVSTKLPWAIILCQFKESSPNLNIEQLIRGIFTQGTGGMIEYWRDSSLGVVDISGSRVFGWVKLDITRQEAGGIGRAALINHAIKAAQDNGLDPINGFYSQIAVFTQDCAIDTDDCTNGGTDWSKWIDGSANGVGPGYAVSAPPHAQSGTFLAHEMGHIFGMQHDYASDMQTAYGDPNCIMSAMRVHRFTHPIWNVPFGPAVSFPHLIQKGWMYRRRLYFDDGTWQTQSEGITLPLAPVTDPGARAYLGIQLTNHQSAECKTIQNQIDALQSEKNSLSQDLQSASTQEKASIAAQIRQLSSKISKEQQQQQEQCFDYYLEYIKPINWNQGIGRSLFLIRRLGPTPDGETSIFLNEVEIPIFFGEKVEFLEPKGNVRFQIEWFHSNMRILKVVAKKL